ncbi:MAG: alpha/beta hydrolase [Magnetovibrio sp.]|nr:alpha/beta hydrolase [Magnetovibrio sp.]
MDDSQPTPRMLNRDNGATIAYHQTPGKHPGVIFLTGFKSDMTGGKALALEAYCRERGHAFTRFDYQGHGQSSGHFDDGTIGEWASDAIDVLDKLTEGPQVLVGSSMGGWMMLLVARARPDRIAGLLGLASAPDFTEDLIPAELSDAQKAALDQNGFVLIPNDYDDGEPYRINKRLLDEGKNQLLLREPLALDCPIRLIHGINDADVPWQTSMRIMETVTSADVEVQLVKAGEHRLSEDHDLARLRRTLGALLDRIGEV